jgi:RNA polymerase sigma factor (sigma-70 family)
LARRARAGDQEALGALAERLRVSLFGLAYTELRHYEDAQDAVAEALLRICQHIGELREPERMRPWSHGIARNEARRIASARRRGECISLSGQEENVGDSPAYTALIDSTAGDVASRLQRLDIRRALEHLPLTHAEAVRLHYLSGLSIEDIARQVGCPAGTVKSWLHHARRRLALEMEAYASAPLMTLTVTSSLRTPMKATMTPAVTPTTSSTSEPVTPEPQTAAQRGADSPSLQTPARERRAALLLQTSLEPAIRDSLIDAVRAGGFGKVDVATEAQIRRILTAVDSIDDAANTAWLAPYSLFVLDEVIAGKPALAYLVLLKSYYLETRRVPVCVLLEEPISLFDAASYYSAGARRLVHKNDPEEFALLAGFGPLWDEPWERFTERARRSVLSGQQEALRLGDSQIGTEHLLGLMNVSDSVGARLLTERLGLSLSQIRSAVKQEAGTEVGTSVSPDTPQLSMGAKRTIDLTYDESRLLGNNYMGAEHLLLGILREPDGLGGRTLRSLGVDLARTRELVREWQRG